MTLEARAALARVRAVNARMTEYTDHIEADFQKFESSLSTNLEALRIATDHTFRLSLLRVLWEVRYELEAPDLDAEPEGVGGMKE